MNLGGDPTFKFTAVDLELIVLLTRQKYTPVLLSSTFVKLNSERLISRPFCKKMLWLSPGLQSILNLVFYYGNIFICFIFHTLNHLSESAFVWGISQGNFISLPFSTAIVLLLSAVKNERNHDYVWYYFISFPLHIPNCFNKIKWPYYLATKLPMSGSLPTIQICLFHYLRNYLSYPQFFLSLFTCFNMTLVSNNIPSIGYG